MLFCSLKKSEKDENLKKYLGIERHEGFEKHGINLYSPEKKNYTECGDYNVLKFSAKRKSERRLIEIPFFVSYDVMSYIKQKGKKLDDCELIRTPIGLNNNIGGVRYNYEYQMENTKKLYMDKGDSLFCFKPDIFLRRKSCPVDDKRNNFIPDDVSVANENEKTDECHFFVASGESMIPVYYVDGNSAKRSFIGNAVVRGQGSRSGYKKKYTSQNYTVANVFQLILEDEIIAFSKPFVYVQRNKVARESIFIPSLRKMLAIPSCGGRCPLFRFILFFIGVFFVIGISIFFRKFELKIVWRKNESLVVNTSSKSLSFFVSRCGDWTEVDNMCLTIPKKHSLFEDMDTNSSWIQCKDNECDFCNPIPRFFVDILFHDSPFVIENESECVEKVVSFDRVSFGDDSTIKKVEEVFPNVTNPEVFAENLPNFIVEDGSKEYIINSDALVMLQQIWLLFSKKMIKNTPLEQLIKLRAEIRYRRFLANFFGNLCIQEKRGCEELEEFGFQYMRDVCVFGLDKSGFDKWTLCRLHRMGIYEEYKNENCKKRSDEDTLEEYQKLLTKKFRETEEKLLF